MAEFIEYYFEPEAEWVAGAGATDVAVRSIGISLKRLVDWLTGEVTTQESASARCVALNANPKANDQAPPPPCVATPAERGATE